MRILERIENLFAKIFTHANYFTIMEEVFKNNTAPVS